MTSLTRARASACLFAVLAVSACTQDARRAEDRQPLTVHIGTFFGRQQPGDPVAQLAGMQSAEPLVSVGWDGQPLPRLAESAVESPDGMFLTIKLRPNVRFHTGELVTAAQVRELIVPKLAATEVSNVEVRDERTLVLNLKRPYAFKTADLSDFYVDDDARPQLRTGPFRLVSLKPVTRLERFEQYHQGTPSVERVEFHPYPNHRAAWTAMMRGEVNFLHEVNRDAIDFIEAGGDIRAYPLLRGFYVALVFNVKQPTLESREVRLALNEAIDREEIVRNGMRGHGEVAEGPFWPHHWAYAAGRHVRAYNPEAAKLRLNAAGRAVRSDGSGMPSRFQFTCLLLEGDTRFERIGLVVQRQLFDIGVDMRLQPLPRLEFLKRVGSGSYDAFLFEFTSGRGLSRAYSFWHSRGGIISTGYAAADEALERMKLAPTADDTRVAVSDVMRIMQSDPPAAFLAWPREARAADRSFELPYERDQDVLGSLWLLRRSALRADAR